MRKIWGAHKIKILTYIYLILLFAGIGYSLGTSSGEVFSLEKKVILIDPGHGGDDPGKVVSKGDKEKEINLIISGYLCKYLEQSGASVRTTRNDDEALAKSKREDLRLRRKLADSDEVDAMISIHQNFYPADNVKGAQVFYPVASEEGKQLADLIQARLKELSGGENTRVTKENNSYYILKNQKKPSVIVECGFLSNPDENKLLNSEEYQKKIAWAIYIGIADYFAAKNKV